MMQVTITKKEPGYTCADCKYFHRHYAMNMTAIPCRDSIRGFVPINCGHCTYPKLKHHKPRDKACQAFVVGK